MTRKSEIVLRHRRYTKCLNAARFLFQQIPTPIKIASIAGIFLPLAGCNDLSQRPTPPAPLAAVPLTPAPAGDVPNSLVFRAPDLDTRPAPRCFHIPPTEIAPPGKSVVFLNVTQQQKQAVADAVTDEFRRAIGRRQRLSNAPGADCATLQLYLTGVTKSTPDQDVAANPYGNLIGMSDVMARNLQASVNGTITVAGKFMAPNGDLLAAFVDKVGTGAIDIPSNATPRQIAMIGAAHIADDIAGAVDREVSVQKRNSR